MYISDFSYFENLQKRCHLETYLWDNPHTLQTTA